jgi:hypothetical protein
MDKRADTETCNDTYYRYTLNVNTLNVKRKSIVGMLKAG